MRVSKTVNAALSVLIQRQLVTGATTLGQKAEPAEDRSHRLGGQLNVLPTARKKAISQICGACKIGPWRFHMAGH